MVRGRREDDSGGRKGLGEEAYCVAIDKDTRLREFPTRTHT